MYQFSDLYPKGNENFTKNPYYSFYIFLVTYITCACYLSLVSLLHVTCHILVGVLSVKKKSFRYLLSRDLKVVH